MAPNIKNAGAERLTAKVAALAGETKTDAVQVAQGERKQQPRATGIRESKQVRVDRLLRERIWPQIPKNVFGRRITKREEDRILGYGPGGV